MNKCLSCNSDAKNKFCSSSCSATFNNKGINRVKSLFTLISDEELVEVFNKSKTKDEFYTYIGYKNRVSNNVRNDAKKRLKVLGLILDDLNIIESVGNKTKGEIFEQRTNWQSARSGIQKDARSVYKKSETKKECLICGYDKHYEVAHIKSVASFTNETLISEINNINNLMALCPNHHWEYDKGLLEIKNP